MSAEVVAKINYNSECFTYYSINSSSDLFEKRSLTCKIEDSKTIANNPCTHSFKFYNLLAPASGTS